MYARFFQPLIYTLHVQRNTLLLPRVPLSPDALHRPIRQGHPDLLLPLLQPLVLPLLPLPHPRHLLLQHNAQTRPRRVHNIRPTARAVIRQLSVRSATNPSLLDENVRSVRDSVALAVLELDIQRRLRRNNQLRRLRAGNIARSSVQVLSSRRGRSFNTNLPQPHPAHNDRLVPRSLQVRLHILRDQLLGEAHLHNRLVQRLALDLPRQHAELLRARLHHLALGHVLALGLHQELGLREPAAFGNALDDFLALPALARVGVRVQHAQHVVAVAGFGACLSGGAGVCGAGGFCGGGVGGLLLGAAVVFEDGGGGDVAAGHGWAGGGGGCVDVGVVAAELIEDGVGVFGCVVVGGGGVAGSCEEDGFGLDSGGEGGWVAVEAWEDLLGGRFVGW